MCMYIRIRIIIIQRINIIKQLQINPHINMIISPLMPINLKYKYVHDYVYIHN